MVQFKSADFDSAVICAVALTSFTLRWVVWFSCRMLLKGPELQ